MSINNLDLIKKLFIYSYITAEEIKRRRAIKSINIASFKKIGENILIAYNKLCEKYNLEDVKSLAVYG